MLRNNKIWYISVVSFCWSTASMMVSSVLPVYLTEQLHVGYVKIGYLEGIAVCCAFVSKVFAGILSDYLQKRQVLILIGSIFSVITKPMLAGSNSYHMVFITRFIDRLAKGIRSAPTDALIADLNREQLNYAFGFRQAIYILGAVFGALLSILIMFFIGNKYQIIFYIATLPALLAVFILLFFIKDPDLKSLNKSICKQAISLKDLKKFSWYYWAILSITFFLMIARFSESFLALKVKQFGWPIFWLPLIIIISDLSHAFFAFITKSFSTKADAEKLLCTGLIVLIIANITWLFAGTNTGIFLGIILTGMHLGITQGILRTLVAMSSAQAEVNINGTAFALFYLVSGAGVFIGNLVAGTLAEKFSLSTIFIGGTIAASIALGLVFMMLLVKTYLPKLYNSMMK